jgi:hypothetical protein
MRDVARRVLATVDDALICIAFAYARGVQLAESELSDVARLWRLLLTNLDVFRGERT